MNLTLNSAISSAAGMTACLNNRDLGSTLCSMSMAFFLNKYAIRPGIFPAMLWKTGMLLGSAVIRLRMVFCSIHIHLFHFIYS